MAPPEQISLSSDLAGKRLQTLAKACKQEILYSSSNKGTGVRSPAIFFLNVPGPVEVAVHDTLKRGGPSADPAQHRESSVEPGEFKAESLLQDNHTNDGRRTNRRGHPELGHHDQRIVDGHPPVRWQNQNADG